MKEVELLSPAGDFECLKQAIISGANAVYFGAKNFNARAKANNFGSDMQSAVAFCHMYGARAYLTLNTLIENDQINELIDTAKYALECGIDAFIVQDFGVLNILKNCFHNVEIHTSTQMAVNNYQGAMMAEKLGAKRVVLSRETSLEDIKLIKQKMSLEIEYFIQGALCVCFSGNCYLSSKIFSKSGNKGECLQPCRLLYKAILKGKVIKEGYLLSAKDLCMANRLKELINVGVDSFKIEGRLRRVSYVAGITKVYRKIIDNNFIAKEEDIINIKKCFNRGDFTEGYLNGNGNIIDPYIQGHKGIEIGKVIDFNKGKKFNVVKIKSNHKINKGDGLKFIFNNKENAIITAVDIKKDKDVYTITTTANIVNGSKVNLFLDFEKEEKDIKSIKKLPLNLKLIANKNCNIKLEYDFNGIKGFVLGESCVSALNKPLNYDEAKLQLEKLGETNFYLNNFELETDGVFVKKQDLNSLRREVVSKIINYFECKKEVNVNYEYLKNIENINSKIQENIKKDEKNIDFGEKFNSNADFLVIKPQNYNTFDYSKISHKNAYLFIPSFLRNGDIKVIENILNKYKNIGVYAENLGALSFNKKTILGAKLNIKNIYAIKELYNENVKLIVTSPEITDENYKILKDFSNIPTIKGSFENFELMTFVHCPIKTLFDNECSSCKFRDDIIYEMENGIRLKLNRYILKNCYFTLTQI